MKSWFGSAHSKARFARELGAVLILGTTFALLAGLAIWEKERDEMAAKFQQAAQARCTVLTREIESQLYVLRACQAFYTSSHEVERSEFHDFARPLLDKMRAVRGVAWVPRVSGPQRQAWEAMAQQQGVLDFKITERASDGRFIPAAPRAEYFPVFFLEAQGDDEAVLGYDLASETSRHATLLQARKSGLAQASPLVNLAPKPGSGYGCLVVAPVYRKLSSEEPELRGFIVTVLRVDDLVESALADFPSAGVSLEVTDGCTSPGEQVIAFVSDASAKTNGAFQKTAQTAAADDDFVYAKDIRFAGRVWQVRCLPSVGSFRVPLGFWPVVTVTLGLAFTGLFAAFLVSLFREGERTTRLVHERTRELVGANQELQEQVRARVQAEERLSASLRQKEMLLREIHHRVNNNLQVISSLLQLQSGHTADPVELRLVKDLRARVRSMALVYEKLHGAPDIGKIDFAEYTRNLAAELNRSLASGGNQFRVQFDLEPILLNLDTAIPCGLILTELLGNALKYAFPAKPCPENGPSNDSFIKVGLHGTADGRIRLEVADNGVGLAPPIELAAPTTIGLQVVKVLVEQLNASLQLEREGGTAYTLTFREICYKPRN